ncbi:MAG: 3-keto-disaccharide hydrolase [Phycisphaeraceae bacterium]
MRKPLLLTTALLALCTMLGAAPTEVACPDCQAKTNAEAERKVAAAMQDSASFSLFDGESLAGWTPDIPAADGKPDAKPSFIVRDGMLVSLGNPRGSLITDLPYENYRLVVEYRFAGKPGNCGVLIHTDVERKRAYNNLWPASLEVQMQHQQAGDFWCIHENIVVPNMAERRSGPAENWGGKRGQSRNIKNLTDDSEHPVGQWNTMQIETLGDKVRVWVNGDLVNEGYDCTAIKGHIALQAEGSEVEFRKIELAPITELTEAKDLPGGESFSLYDGKTLDGWYADVPDADDNPDIKPSFLIRDGMLVSMGRPLGHLITKKSFKDYRLEVQYRFADKPGNCGVLIHTDGKRPRVLYDMFPASIEVQLQHKQAGDFWCIHENISVPNMAERRRGPAENYGGKKGQSRHIKNLTDGSENELGEWNTMIIETLGDKIRVWVNNDLVNDGFDATASEGQVALQAEGAHVEFRKLEMTPIKELTEAKDLPKAE